MSRVFTVEQFVLLEQLGKGSFGVVYKALDKVTNRVVAIKQIDLENSDEDIDEIQKEITILSTCKFPQIIKYYGSFVSNYQLSIIMELVNGGSCLDLLIALNCFRESQIAIMCRELLKALYYLHSNNKIHRDIKAANILIDDNNGDVKVVDFGVATQLSNNLSKRNTFVGTPFWMSPEVILQHDYTYSTDIWSLGITAIELALGKPPLSDIHPLKVLFLIPKNAAPTLPAKNPTTHETYSKNFHNFIKLCLQKNPASRPSAKQLLHHPFIKNAGKNKELLEIVKQYRAVTASANASATGSSGVPVQVSNSIQNPISDLETNSAVPVQVSNNSNSNSNSSAGAGAGATASESGSPASPQKSAHRRSRNSITSQITFDFDEETVGRGRSRSGTKNRRDTKRDTKRDSRHHTQQQQQQQSQSQSAPKKSVSSGSSESKLSLFDFEIDVHRKSGQSKSDFAQSANVSPMSGSPSSQSTRSFEHSLKSSVSSFAAAPSAQSKFYDVFDQVLCSRADEKMLQLRDFLKATFRSPQEFGQMLSVSKEILAQVEATKEDSSANLQLYNQLIPTKTESKRPRDDVEELLLSRWAEGVLEKWDSVV